MLIYHIVLPSIWEEFKNKDLYEADSLRSDGFIHCSFAEQLDAVLKRYYGDADRVVVLSVDTEKLSSPLVQEPSTNNEAYPHIYGKINRSAIVGIETREL